MKNNVEIIRRVGDISITTRENNHYETLHYVKVGQEQILFVANMHVSSNYEIQWKPSNNLSKDKLVDILVEESINLIPTIMEHNTQQENKIWDAHVLYEGKAFKPCRIGYEHEYNPDLIYTDVEGTAQKIREIEGYDRLDCLYFTNWGIRFGLVQYGGIWSHEKGSVVIFQNPPIGKWIAKLYERTSAHANIIKDNKVLQLL